ncbi:5-formyltetrahydrofolate cyclo-ligase [Pseudahrensia aquimaris]|uniref:5-formyltetrahydrofolate cyclo-ligase n=1 Tax=Pseudahrensia aquimaris TaxID=744461 RepID=A0ABW3F9W5_9HYPH
MTELVLNNPTQQKANLRKTALSRRDALAEDARIEASLAAAEFAANYAPLNQEFMPGTVVAGFHPIRSEIDPRPLMATLAARGARLCLPVVTDKTTIIFRELIRGAPMVKTGFGTVGPDENAAVLDPQILLVPLSVFDTRGGRIGYGAGFYDRAIDKLIAKGITPKLIGMAYALQQADEVPMEPHDRFLDAVITEKGVIDAKGNNT